MIFLIKSSGKDILTLDTDNIVSIPSNNQICVGDIWVNIENKQYFFHQIQDISNPKNIKRTEFISINSEGVRLD